MAEQQFYGRDNGKWHSTKLVLRRNVHKYPKRGFLKFSLGCLFVCSMFWAWLKLTDPLTFPIRSIQIKGNYPHVDHNLLRQVILPFVQNGFLRIDTAGLQDRLLQLPWVYSASVHRIWPGALMISLVEQNAVARFNGYTLVNAQGDLFSVVQTETFQGMPNFIGPEGQQKLMLQNYQQMSAILAPLNVKITTLRLDTRQSWQLQLNNGMVVLIGKIDPLGRLQRFVDVYPQIVNQKTGTIITVDLQYSHGIAVHFDNQDLKPKV